SGDPRTCARAGTPSWRSGRRSGRGGDRRAPAKRELVLHCALASARYELTGRQVPPSRRPQESSMPEEQPHALVERRGHCLLVTMNRREARNAVSPEMVSILESAWDQVNSDPDIRVAILTGAGGAFSAGADLKAMSKRPPGDAFKGDASTPAMDMSVMKW